MARPFKAVKNTAIFGVIAMIFAAFNAMPLNGARALGAALGRLFFRIVPFERKKTLRMLTIAYPDLPESERLKIASGVFAHLGRGGAEFMRWPRLKPADLDGWISHVDGFENLKKHTDAGRGVVAVTAHLGHWELLASWTAARVPVAVVARQLYDDRLDRKLNAFREGKGMLVFPRNTSVRPILKWLKDGKVLGVLADQDTGVDSCYVPFFGREAKTPSGPAFLASATGAAIVTAFCWREADGRYRMRFDDEVPVAPRATEKRLLRPAVLEYTRRTEAAIREAPEQWVFNHDRWRSAKSQASTGWDPSEE